MRMDLPNGAPGSAAATDAYGAPNANDGYKAPVLLCVRAEYADYAAHAHRIDRRCSLPQSVEWEPTVLARRNLAITLLTHSGKVPELYSITEF